MAFVAISDQEVFFPSRLFPAAMILSLASGQLDATGEKLAFCGRFWHPDRTSKSVRNVCLRFASVVKSGGSGLTVSLQDVSLTTGPPMQPDETQDETVAIANGDAGFTSNVWYETGNLSADRSVSPGDLLAAVVEFDGSGRLGTDIIQVTYMGAQYSTPRRDNSVSHKTGGAWAGQSGLPNLALKCSDGSYGTLSGSFALSAMNTHTFANNSNPDEYAMAFQVPVPMKIDGLWADVAATVDYDLVLYEGTTQLAAHSFDGNTQPTSSGRIAVATIAEQTLSTGTTYYLAVKPTTTSTVSAYSFDVNAAALLALHGGTAFNYSTRLDAGSWAAATTTRRLHAGVRVSALDDGTSAGTGGGAAGVYNVLGGGVVRAA